MRSEEGSYARPRAELVAFRLTSRACPCPEGRPRRGVSVVCTGRMAPDRACMASAGQLGCWCSTRTLGTNAGWWACAAVAGAQAGPEKRIKKGCRAECPYGVRQPGRAQLSSGLARCLIRRPGRRLCCVRLRSNRNYLSGLRHLGPYPDQGHSTSSGARVHARGGVFTSHVSTCVRHKSGMH